MSVIGKGSTSFKKKDVVEQKSIALGFKKLVFAHKATAGEAGINLTALVTPTEMSTQGFVNPSVANLSRTNIFQNKNNLKIVSSLAGILIPYMSYTVNSSTYIAFNGFTAAADEVFTCYIDEAPATSLSVVDGEPIIASGILLAGQTDFNIGTPIPLNQNPAQQIGAVMVYADRGLQYRKVGNITSGDGDYIEVPVAGGLGSLIRFNASGVDRFITVVSNGVVAERPDGSMTALIERVQGQVDAMVPTLAAVAGVPTTTFQTAPNSIDLKQFGDTVLSQQVELDDHEVRIDAIETGPSIQRILSGSGSFITPAGAKWLKIRMAGGGAGGDGSGLGGGPGSGANGGDTTFGSATAGGGIGGNNDSGGAGGTFSLGSFTNGFGYGGGEGGAGTASDDGGDRGVGGFGGETPFLGGGGKLAVFSTASSLGHTNTGGGGQGGGTAAVGNVIGGGGGGSGAYVEFIVSAPAASYPYTVGAGGAGGPAGSSGIAGGTGGSGVIIIEVNF